MLETLNINRQNKQKALDILTRSFLQDPIFKYYSKTTGRKHFKKTKAIIKMDIDKHLAKKEYAKILTKNKKPIGVILAGKREIPFTATLKGFFYFLIKLGIPTMLRMIKISNKTNYKLMKKQDIYIAEIAIEKQERKKGYGTFLIKKLEEKYPKKSIGLITENKSNLIFYKKNNFRLEDKSEIFGITKYYLIKN